MKRSNAVLLILRDEEKFAQTYARASKKGGKMKWHTRATANDSPEWTVLIFYPYWN